MPFAPYMMYIDAEKNLKNYEETDYSANFMTITYHVSEEIKKKAHTVVHIDGTSRPQIIKRVNNELNYDISEKFKEITKISCLINTRFNAQE
jgi:carbamoyltransferase